MKWGRRIHNVVWAGCGKAALSHVPLRQRHVQWHRKNLLNTTFNISGLDLEAFQAGDWYYCLLPGVPARDHWVVYHKDTKYAGNGMHHYVIGSEADAELDAAYLVANGHTIGYAESVREQNEEWDRLRREAEAEGLTLDEYVLKRYNTIQFNITGKVPK